MQKQIRHEVILTHSLETAYQLLTKPKLISQWFCESVNVTPDGFHVRQRTADGKQLEFHTTIIDNVPNKWVIMETDDERMLTTRYSLYPEADRKCRMEILETGFTNDEAGNQTFKERQTSWNMFVERLSKVSVA